MRPRWLVLIAMTFCFSTVGATAAESVQAKKSAIIAYLQELQMHKQTLSGVQINEFEAYMDCTSFDRLKIKTGKSPAMLGLELMNAIAVPPYKDFVIDRALTQTENGGLVTLTWHERNPLEVCIRGEFFDCVQKPMTEETLRAILTAGTRENHLWLADVDKIAAVLKTFRDRGIVVLLRPYHEMNGGWFWWGKKGTYPQLWDALYEELVERQGLDNLIWVWSSDRATPDAARFAPVKHKPDIVGIDVYETDQNSPAFTDGRNNLAATFGRNTPFAITEVGIVPTEAVLETTNPAWVLLWGGEYLDGRLVMKGVCTNCNTAEQIDAFLKIRRIQSREDLPAKLRSLIASGVKNDHPLHEGKPDCPTKLH
jgi:hypothetical protein